MKYTMGRISVIGLAAAGLCAGNAAAQSFSALDLKTGEWETTTTMQTAGAPAIPPGVLDKMPPEQRAKMEEMIKSRMGGGSPTVTRTCVTKEMLSKAFASDKIPPSCKYTVISSSSSRQDMSIACDNGKTKSVGTFHIVAVDSSTMKGTMQMTASSERAQQMNMNMDYASKWVGPVCSEASKKGN